MDEYASLRKIEFELCGGNLPEKYKKFIRRVLNDRNLIPAADVAPVVHGRWVDGKCSNCGVDIPTDDLRDVIFESDCHFCYSCGAKMDRGECDAVN